MNQSAAKRLLLILERLTGRPEGMALGELCADLNLPKSIGHRLLRLLEEAGYVRQVGPGEAYVLTLKLTALGMQHYVCTGIDDLAQPILDQLATETGELVRLAVVDGSRLIWVAKAQGARAGLRYDPGFDHDSGHDVVLRVTATGKAWLATLPTAHAIAIVKATGLATPGRFGPNAVRSIRQFKAKLEETIKAGYGEAIDEGEPGTSAVAVAVREGAASRGEAVGTLSVAGPTVRFIPARRAQLAARLRRAADELGRIWPLRGGSSKSEQVLASARRQTMKRVEDDKQSATV